MPDDIFETPEGKTPDPVAAVKEKFGNDLDAIAKGKAEADAFIESLKKELAGVRAQLNPQFDAEKSLQELRAEIQALKSNPDQGRSREVTPPALTSEGIAALVEQEITRAERNRTSQQNIQSANDAVVAAFGSLDAAGTAVKAKAAELGMSVADLKGIAEKSPSAFQKIILGDASNGAGEQPLVVPSANRGDGRAPVGEPKRGTNEYFDAILKKDRKLYWSPAVQMELHKAAADGTYLL